MCHAWGRGESFTGLWLGSLKGRPRRRWEDDMEMDLREIGMNGVNWIRLAQYRVWRWAFVNT